MSCTLSHRSHCDSHPHSQADSSLITDSSLPPPHFHLRTHSTCFLPHALSVQVLVQVPVQLVCQDGIAHVFFNILDDRMTHVSV